MTTSPARQTWCLPDEGKGEGEGEGEVEGEVEGEGEGKVVEEEKDVSEEKGEDERHTPEAEKQSS